jgi:hypothetical protein
MASRYRPNPQRQAQLQDATDKALYAAAQVATLDVRKRYAARRQGYTSGDFATVPGGVHATVTQSDAHEHEGKRRVLIGTNRRSPAGYPYPLAWELGHFNIFLRKFVRVETWRPALDENRDKIRATFQRVFRTVLGRTTGTP